MKRFFKWVKIALYTAMIVRIVVQVFLTLMNRGSNFEFRE